MNTYEVWVNLRPGVKDLEFVKAVEAYLELFIKEGFMHSYRIRRRKFGFGPEALGEFNISMVFETLAKLDEAFKVAAARKGEAESLHHAVYASVVDFKSGLWRDFPDPERG